MYTYELAQFLQERNFCISNREYIRVVQTSKQIDHIKYNPYECNFELWTTDGYNARFTVYQEGLDD